MGGRDLIYQTNFIKKPTNNQYKKNIEKEITTREKEYCDIIKERVGCEIIHNTENVIQELETKPISVVKEKTIDIQKQKNDIDICECGGKIIKLKDGTRCCEWCIKDY